MSAQPVTRDVDLLVDLLAGAPIGPLPANVRKRLVKMPKVFGAGLVRCGLRGEPERLGGASTPSPVALRAPRACGVRGEWERPADITRASSGG